MMTPIRTFLLTCAALAASPAHAQAPSPAEAEVVPRILDHTCHELRDDLIGCEMLVLALAPGGGGADLFIHPHPNSGADPQAIASVRNVAWAGGMFGQLPWLEAAGDTVFRIHSEQIGIGRSPWEQVVTVAWRGGEFVVAGVTYSTWDRLNLRAFQCDLNLRTGSWIVTRDRAEEDRGKVAPLPLPLAEWNAEAALPAPCDAQLEAWWQSED